jgi:hypothetical protein
MPRAAMQQLLGSREFAEAAHEALQPFAKAVPALALPLPDLAARLRGAAAGLHFVSRCRTKIVVKRGGAGGAEGGGRTGPPSQACTALLSMRCHTIAHVDRISTSLVIAPCLLVRHEHVTV